MWTRWSPTCDSSTVGGMPSVLRYTRSTGRVRWLACTGGNQLLDLRAAAETRGRLEPERRLLEHGRAHRGGIVRGRAAHDQEAARPQRREAVAEGGGDLLVAQVAPVEDVHGADHVRGRPERPE